MHAFLWDLVGAAGASAIGLHNLIDEGGSLAEPVFRPRQADANGFVDKVHSVSGTRQAFVWQSNKMDCAVCRYLAAHTVANARKLIARHGVSRSSKGVKGSPSNICAVQARSGLALGIAATKNFISTKHRKPAEPTGVRFLRMGDNVRVFEQLATFIL